MMAFDSSRFECYAARPNEKKHLYLLIRLRKEYNSHMDSIYMILLSFSLSFYPFLLYCLTKDGFFLRKNNYHGLKNFSKIKKIIFF